MNNGKILSILTTIIITAVIAGGGVYLWQNTNTTSFLEYWNIKGYGNQEIPQDFVTITSVFYDQCPNVNEIDGGCEHEIFILGKKDWGIQKGVQPFYFMEIWQDRPRYFGPFLDDLKRIIKEAKKAATR